MLQPSAVPWERIEEIGDLLPGLWEPGSDLRDGAMVASGLAMIRLANTST